MHSYHGKINNDYFTIVAKGAQAYELPDPASKTLGVLPEGTRFKVLSEYGSYLEIKIPNRSILKRTPNYKNTSYKKTWKELRDKNKKIKKY